MTTTTLTFVEGTSSKFYTLSLDGKTLRIQFGRIGSPGQTKLAKYPSEAAAQKEYAALLTQKKKKGYQENGAPAATDVATGRETPTPEAKPAAGKKATLAPAAAPAATKKKGPGLPTPALEDPPVPGLDLVQFRAGPLPIPERDPTPFPSGDFLIEGYSISFGDGDEVVVTDPKGKKLKSVPPKLRKTEDYQALMRGRKDDRARERKARRVLEDRMISGAPFSADEISWLAEDDAFAPLIKGTIVHPVGEPREAGLLLTVDPKKGLGVLPLDYDAKWLGARDVIMPHPMSLGDVMPWQDLLVDVSMQQALVQAFREVRKVPTAQRKLTESAMLANRETRAASTVERNLMEEGWVVRRGMARRRLTLRVEDKVVSVEAWFDYGEFYEPSEGTTTGNFGFNGGETGRPIKFLEVPDVLISEAVRSIELCLAKSGAKKDEDAEEDEAAEGEDGEAGEGGGGDDDGDDD